MKHALLLLCCLGLWPFAAPAANGAKLTAFYNITRAEQPIGEIQEELELSAGRYRLQSTTTPAGVVAIFVKEVITQVSSGTHDESGFHPEQYQYLRSAKPKKNLEATFNRENQSATFHYDGKIVTQALPPLLQDRLSLGYQLRYWPKDTDQQILAVSNGKTIHEYQLTRSGEETISVPAGKFQTTRFVRERTAEHDGITVWISPKVPAPIKVVIAEKKGAVTEQVLARITSD